jgi:hypothetical protein
MGVALDTNVEAGFSEALDSLHDNRQYLHADTRRYAGVSHCKLRPYDKKGHVKPEHGVAGG